MWVDLLCRLQTYRANSVVNLMGPYGIDAWRNLRGLNNRLFTIPEWLKYPYGGGPPAALLCDRCMVTIWVCSAVFLIAALIGLFAIAMMQQVSEKEEREKHQTQVEVSADSAEPC